MIGTQMITKQSLSRSIKLACILLLVTAFNLVDAGSTAYAKKKKIIKADHGSLKISTNPGGYPILIDGQPNGTTTSSETVINLSPGRHTVEVDLPNGNRWIREFDVAQARIYCIALNYNPRTITITKVPCPYPVNVSAPSTVNEGDTITFSSDVTYGGTSALNYTWTVSPPSARIVSGAGTPTITVDTTGLGRQRVMAVLVVDDGSGEPACRQAARAATDVIPAAVPVPTPRKFDEFPSVSFDDDKARLDNLAVELQNTPNAQGYIIIYGGRTSRAGQADRLAARTTNYLVRNRGIDPNRIVVINGGYRERDEFEVWIVPPGAQPPQASPSVQPSEIQPGASPVHRRRRSR